jgi:hypothetical protein
MIKLILQLKEDTEVFNSAGFFFRRYLTCICSIKLENTLHSGESESQNEPLNVLF